MEKFITNKPAFFKATLPASTKLADLDEERSNLERMSADLEQASSQAWLDAQRAAERMLAKRAAASLGSIPASVVTVPVVPQPAGNKTLAKEKPDLVANIPVKPLPVTGGQVRLTRVQGGVAKFPTRTFREALMPKRPQVPPIKAEIYVISGPLRALWGFRGPRTGFFRPRRGFFPCF